jgi:hypothetical protein
LLEVEFLNSILIWSNSSALNTNLGVLDCFSSVNSNLIICGISALNTQIHVDGLKINVRFNVLILNPLPDDSGHFITININDWVSNGNSGSK